MAEAGLLSRANITALVDDGYKFILGARPKSESSDVKERILALEMKDGDVGELDKDKANGVRQILSLTEKRKKRDKNNREKGLERLRKKYATHIQNQKSPRKWHLAWTRSRGSYARLSVGRTSEILGVPLRKTGKIN